MSESNTSNIYNGTKSNNLSEEDLNQIINFRELKGNVEITKCAMQSKRQNLEMIESSLEEIDILFDSSDNMLKLGNCFFIMEVEEMEKFLAELEKEEKQKLQKLTNDFQSFTSKKEMLTKQLVERFGADILFQ